MVTGLIVMTILTHSQSAHLGHFVDFLPVTADAKCTGSRQQLVQLPKHNRFTTYNSASPPFSLCSCLPAPDLSELFVVGGAARVVY